MLATTSASHPGGRESCADSRAGYRCSSLPGRPARTAGHQVRKNQEPAKRRWIRKPCRQRGKRYEDSHQPIEAARAEAAVRAICSYWNDRYPDILIGLKYNTLISEGVIADFRCFQLQVDVDPSDRKMCRLDRRKYLRNRARHLHRLRLMSVRGGKGGQVDKVADCRAHQDNLHWLFKPHHVGP